jgi:transposase
MWTQTTRQQHSRTITRYQTDLTDAEWRVIAPHLPKPCATGRPRQWPMREIINGIFYVMRAGCPWRLLPNDLPPWRTIYRWFAAWRDDGRFERINHALVMADRERVGRDASPSAAIIDSQSVKTTEAGVGHVVTMLERRSTDASATRWSTPTAVASCSNRIRRASRIATAADRCCGPHAASCRLSGSSSLTAGMPARRSPGRRWSRLRSCAKTLIRSASLLTRGAGSSNDFSRGSGAIADSQRTSRPPSTPHAPSSTPHPSCCSCVGSLVLHDFRNRLLGIFTASVA